jgi:hypothetical protein
MPTTNTPADQTQTFNWRAALAFNGGLILLAAFAYGAVTAYTRTQATMDCAENRGDRHDPELLAACQDDLKTEKWW